MVAPFEQRQGLVVVTDQLVSSLLDAERSCSAPDILKHVQGQAQACSSWPIHGCTASLDSTTVFIHSIPQKRKSLVTHSETTL
jgi:hypothetical protein